MDKFPIEPLMDRVFVKKDDADVDANSGLFLPDSVKGRAETGIVVAVGPGYLDTMTGKFYPMSVKVGDKVWVKEFSGYVLRYKGQQVFIFSEKEIIGRVLE